MNKPIRQCTPGEQSATGGPMADNPGGTGSDVSGSRGTGDEEDDSEDEYDAGSLTGTDRDETGPNENMATES